MFLVLKILHVLAFTAGVGGGLANLVVLRALKSADPDAQKVLRGLMPRIGTMGFHSVLLLWVTGLTMWWLAYAGHGSLGIFFHLKMLGVVLLTIVIVSVRITVGRVKAGKPAVLAPHIPKLLPLGSAFGVITIILAVLTFS